MSVILSQEYGHAMLEHLDVLDICVLLRVDVATRSFLTSSDLVGTKTFGEYIISKTDDLKCMLLVYVELDLLKEFKSVVEPLGIPEDSEDREELLSDLIEVCNAAIKKGKVEYLEATANKLYSLYDWEYANYDDYSFDFIDLATRCDRPSVVKYILRRCKEEGMPRTDDCMNEYLHKGLSAAGSTKNVPAADFFLSHPDIEIYSEQFEIILKLNDDALYDKHVNKISIPYYWYHWHSVQRMLDRVINNDYLYQKVCELILKETVDPEVRANVPRYRSGLM